MVSRHASSDEGEIVENRVNKDLKANTQPHLDGSVVDRRDRNRGRRSTPPLDGDDRPRSYHANPDRSRSPHGRKRPRDDRDPGYRGGHGGKNGGGGGGGGGGGAAASPPAPAAPIRDAFTFGTRMTAATTAVATGVPTTTGITTATSSRRAPPLSGTKT